MNKVDIAIIGSGPAGVSAAINAQIRHKSFYLFGDISLSDKVQKSECISNYPAFTDISGADFNKCLNRQLSNMKISVVNKRITGIYKMKDYFALLADQEEFDADTIIIATGVETVRQIVGEHELLGRGISYCATCDGNLYKGKTIAAVCDNPLMEEEVSYLADLAEKIYYFPMFKGSSFTAENVEILSSPVTEILGENRVKSIKCNNGNEIEVDGVFFLKQSISPAVLLHGIEMDDRHVAVNRNMETNIKGCFAAGDCTGTPYQIAKAVGEGNIAAHSAFKYLAEKADSNKQ
ncbi:MAG: NAD(P)/FAD-dependent oxidoreductase [Acetobacter sp.]|nr:NAD(P)/FAD-dependent oxidoreductase [Bacteroides sp.]MCM1341072.1 NAD(P)/FAD-dependent oxidoreductase [Acetobacter sp.]MCM1433595.1 NAD(P)/FAD-dependent oxidoreductase [Clostridiales bacterium]